MSDELIEGAKATQEVAKTTGKAIELGQELVGFFKQVFGELITDTVGIAADWIKSYRQERLLVLAEKTNARLKARGISQTITVAPKLGVPLLQHASLEEDDDLMEMWANLLVNTMDPGSEEKPRRVFVDILANLEPIDAKILDFLSRQGWELFKAQHIPQARYLKEGHGPQGFTVERLSKSLGISESDVRLALINLFHQGCIISETANTWDDMGVLTSGISVHDKKAIFRPTDLGWALMQACASEPQRNRNTDHET